MHRWAICSVGTRAEDSPCVQAQDVINVGLCRIVLFHLPTELEPYDDSNFAYQHGRRDWRSIPIFDRHLGKNPRWSN